MKPITPTETGIELLEFVTFICNDMVSVVIQLTVVYVIAEIGSLLLKNFMSTRGIVR